MSSTLLDPKFSKYDSVKYQSFSFHCHGFHVLGCNALMFSPKSPYAFASEMHHLILFYLKFQNMTGSNIRGFSFTVMTDMPMSFVGHLGWQVCSCRHHCFYFGDSAFYLK